MAYKFQLKWSKKRIVLAAVIAVVVVIVVVAAIAGGSTPKEPTDVSGGNSDTPSALPVGPANTNTAPPKPHEQVVADYKASAQPVTMANLQKDPNAYQGKIVTFTASISKFLQDSSGNTGAMNVSNQSDFSSVYVNLSPYIDLSKVNVDDTVQIWGEGLGMLSGQNAFGGTVNVAGVNEVYLLDTTTGYSDDTNLNP